MTATAPATHPEVEHANQALETAFEELQSTDEEPETTNEELETMNEELRMKGVLRAVLDACSEGETLVLEAVNRRGRAIACEVAVTSLVAAGPDVRGAVIVVEERPARDG